MDVIQTRLYNQHLTTHSASPLTDPAAVVAYLGAVQSQDYLAALWAVGLRMPAATEASIAQAFDDGAILRTHVMRPTWHFVTPADVRWMLELTAPRVHQLNAYYYRQLELDDALLHHSDDLIVRALEGGKHLTRAELLAALEAAGIDTTEQLRGTFVVLHAELEGLICSGARRGKQQTYALLSERAPNAKSLPHDDALAELTRRYFTGHAPATLKDFAWWSGLTVADARAGIDLVGSQLLSETIDGETHFFAESASPEPASPQPAAYLLPNYDEYVVGYTDRSTIYDPVHDQHLDARGNFLFNHTILLDGQVVGIWKRTLKRTLKKGSVTVDLTPFIPFTADQTEAIRAAAHRYADFLGLSLSLRGL